MVWGEPNPDKDESILNPTGNIGSAFRAENIFAICFQVLA